MESDFDPDPVARSDGMAKQHRFLRSLGFVADAVRRQAGNHPGAS
jgi:hypothetical protein